MRFALRAASAVDVDDLIALWEGAAKNGSRPPDTAEAVTALLHRDPQAVILADQGGVLIGSIIAGWDGWRYHLYRLGSGRTAEGRASVRPFLALRRAG